MTAFAARLVTDLREMYHEQVDYREVLWSMTRRDIVLRYRQAIMGFGWAIAMPVLNMVVFSVIFTRVTTIETSLPYPIFAYAGLLPWNLFQSSLRFATSSMTTNTVLVTKIYFPREMFPFSAILVCLVDFVVAATILVGLMAYYGIGVTWTVFFLPVVLVVQLAFTSGIALLLAMGNLFFRDVKYLQEVVVAAWMFATSVVYPVDQIDGKLGLVLQLNPMTPIIDAYRACLLRGELPAAEPFLAASVISFATLALAWVAFHRAEFRFAENI
jgi:homopolymeric O-antigen transport system permease protein